MKILYRTLRISGVKSSATVRENSQKIPLEVLDPTETRFNLKVETGGDTFASVQFIKVSATMAVSPVHLTFHRSVYRRTMEILDSFVHNEFSGKSLGRTIDPKLRWKRASEFYIDLVFDLMKDDS